MKRILSLMSVVAVVFTLLVFAPSSVHAETSGTCGDNLTWTFDDNGTLTISGTGDMYDYDRYDIPWGDMADYITSVTINEGVTSIGSNAFNNCSSLTSVAISNSVTSIGYDAFYNCSSLTSVTIPESVTEIGSCIFDNCDILSAINVEAGNRYYCSVDGVLYDENMLQLIRCPEGKVGDYTIPDSVTNIMGYAFYSCNSITSVTIPDSVICIGNYAFDDCDGLTSIAIPDSVISIGRSAFSGCHSLTSVTIPDGVTSIDDYAFSSCNSLTSVTIGDKVTSIGGNTFAYCAELASVTIGNGVTNIGDDAFYNCRRLASVTIPNSMTNIGWNAFSYCDNLAEVVYNGTIQQWDAINKKSGNTMLINAYLSSMRVDYAKNESGILDFSVIVPERLIEVGGKVIVAGLDSNGTIVQSGMAEVTSDNMTATIPIKSQNVVSAKIVLLKFNTMTPLARSLEIGVAL